MIFAPYGILPAVATTPVMLRMQLAYILRELREQAGRIPHEDLARFSGTTKSSLSRYEAGMTVPKAPVLRRILEVLGVDEEHPATVRGQSYTLEDLEEMAERATRRGWLQSRLGDVSVPDWLFTYFGLEPAAEELRIFHSYIPGLFQTRAYATAVIQAEVTGMAEVDNLVQIRMGRQELFSRSSPPVMHVVLDEGCLHRRVHSREVMREQLRHLIERAALPSVTLQVLPFSVGVHAARVAASFVILTFGERHPDVVYHEHYGRTGNLIEGEAQTTLFLGAFRDLAEHALTPDETVAMLRAMAGRTRAS